MLVFKSVILGNQPVENRIVTEWRQFSASVISHIDSQQKKVFVQRKPEAISTLLIYITNLKLLYFDPKAKNCNLGVLENPLYATKCEHAFCGDCIGEWLAQHQNCPLGLVSSKFTQFIIYPILFYMVQGTIDLKRYCFTEPFQMVKVCQLSDFTVNCPLYIRYV